MNEICTNASALPPWRDPALLAAARQREATTQNPTEIVDDSPAVLGTISTDTERPDDTNSTAGAASISADKFLSSATVVTADTDFYIADDGVSIITTSSNVTFADQTLTSVRATPATGIQTRILYTIYDTVKTRQSARADFAPGAIWRVTVNNSPVVCMCICAIV